MSNDTILFFLAFVSFTFYFFEVFMFSDLVLDGSRFNKFTRVLTSTINGGMTTLFFAYTLNLPLMYSYLSFFVLLSINFFLFYKSKYLNKLFFVLAYMIHFMSLGSIVMGAFATIRDTTLYDIAYTSTSMFHTIILIALLGATAITIVRRIIPAVEIKIINNHNVQLYFMVVWLTLFNILMIFNANMFSINVDHPYLKLMQFIIPIVILSGLYIVLFFAIKMGHLLGYKEQTEELQEQIGESEKKQLELQVRADRDPLTKLYNKEVTRSRIEDFITVHKQDSIAALFLIDVDNFKSVNDQKGHIIGDEVICALASNLQSLFRAQDIVGRVGGDEFMVFMKDVVDESSVYLKASEICRAFYLEFENKDGTMNNVSASVGISIYPIDGTSFPELYNNADIALYHVKENGKNSFEIYNSKSRDLSCVIR